MEYLIWQYHAIEHLMLEKILDERITQKNLETLVSVLIAQNLVFLIESVPIVASMPIERW